MKTQHTNDCRARGRWEYPPPPRSVAPSPPCDRKKCTIKTTLIRRVYIVWRTPRRLPVVHYRVDQMWGVQGRTRKYTATTAVDRAEETSEGGKIILRIVFALLLFLFLNINYLYFFNVRISINNWVFFNSMNVFFNF